MAMTAPERLACMADMMQRASIPGSPDKTALLAALSYADDWCDLKQAEFVSGIPEPFKSASNAAQKRLLLIYVIAARDAKKVT